jgi:hypothetical protein
MVELLMTTVQYGLKQAVGGAAIFVATQQQLSDDTVARLLI